MKETVKLQNKRYVNHPDYFRSISCFPKGCGKFIQINTPNSRFAIKRIMLNSRCCCTTVID